MRYSYHILVFLWLLIGCDTASSIEPIYENYFIKYYGKDGDQEGIDLLVNSDGSMVMLGNSLDEATAYIVKVDPQGRIIWHRQVGGSDTRAVDIELINQGVYQGNLIIATNVGEGNETRIGLIRISQQGIGLDSVILNSNSKQVARSVTSLDLEEGFAVTGSAGPDFIPEETEPINSANDVEDILSIKVPDDFSVVDEELELIIGQSGEKNGTGLKLFDTVIDGVSNYLIFGYSDRLVMSNTFNYNIEALLTKPLVQKAIIRKTAGTENEVEIASAVIKTPPSLGAGYLIIGTAQNSNDTQVPGELYLAKFDERLESKSIEKKLGIGSNFRGVSASAAPPLGYYLLANIIRENGQSDIFISMISYDASRVIWTNSFGTERGQDYGASINTLPDGRIALLGTMELELETQKKMALIILNPNGKLAD